MDKIIKDRATAEAITKLKKDVRKKLHDMAQPIMFLSGCISLAQMDGAMNEANLNKADAAINKLMAMFISLQTDLNKGELK